MYSYFLANSTLGLGLAEMHTGRTIRRHVYAYLATYLGLMAERTFNVNHHTMATPAHQQGTRCDAGFAFAVPVLMS